MHISHNEPFRAVTHQYFIRPYPTRQYFPVLPATSRTSLDHDMTIHAKPPTTTSQGWHKLVPTPMLHNFLCLADTESVHLSRTVCTTSPFFISTRRATNQFPIFFWTKVPFKIVAPIPRVPRKNLGVAKVKHWRDSLQRRRRNVTQKVVPEIM